MLIQVNRTLFELKTSLESQAEHISPNIHITVLARLVDTKTGEALAYDL